MNLAGKLNTEGGRTELLTVPISKTITATLGCPWGQVRLTLDGMGIFSVQMTDEDGDFWQTVCQGNLELQRAVDPRGMTE